MNQETLPTYLTLDATALEAKLARAARALHDCHLCGNDCGIDRTERAGPCRIGAELRVVSYGPHHGEEDVLRGSCGSGTIFFAGCNMHCVYCQNYSISQRATGNVTPPAALAAMMLELQAHGCHNINLVSPTHVATHLVPGIVQAIREGLRLPIIYNTGGYDAPQALALMDGLIDIYMPDMKYADAKLGWELSKVKNYPQINQDAVREMHQQVGDLLIDDAGIAQRGLLVRHLVLPRGIAGTAAISRFLVEDVSPNTYINIMQQYHPAYEAWRYVTKGIPLDQPVTLQEYQTAIQQARAAGLYRFDKRQL